MINSIKTMLVLGVFLATAAASAQVARSVSGGEGAVWAGGEFSSFSPDYDRSRVMGPGVIFDVNVTPKIGMIGEARWMHWNGDDGQTHSDYLLGGKYRAYRYHRFDFDAKFLLGGVWIKFPDDIGSGSYFAYAPGLFVDYRLSDRFKIRGDYEYQFLPSAPNIPGQNRHGLTPNGFSLGVEYLVFR